MTRYTLHIPEQYNDGREVPGYLLDQIELDLVDIVGGFTRTAGTGGWRGEENVVYVEPVQLYIVDSADPDVLRKLTDYAAWLARELAQEAIYLTAQDIQTYLVTAREEIQA